MSRVDCQSNMLIRALKKKKKSQNSEYICHWGLLHSIMNNNYKISLEWSGAEQQQFKHKSSLKIAKEVCQSEIVSLVL